ncbi:MAG TPA: hypothetical protein DDW28_10845 [Prevotella sp.]|nr:hypothetical protein [uncultured Prevotella sp.]HBF06539.1 hypothetical protein [Candidatus Segatella violae]
MENHIPGEIMRKVKQDLIHEVLAIPNRMTSGNEPIKLEPTFRGSEYYDSSMYLKFNNAIERMAQPRDVEQVEIDVESVCRNEWGSVYAVAAHYPSGLIDTDMLTRMRGTDKMSKGRGYGWSSYQTKFRFHPLFVSAYIASIYGFQKVSDLQIAKELMVGFTALGKSVFYGNYCLSICAGGIEIIRCIEISKGEGMTVEGNVYPRPTEAIDFIPYEEIDSASIKNLYSHVLHRYVEDEDYNVDDVINDDLAKEIFELSLSRLKKKVGDKGMDLLTKMDERG